MTNVAVGGMNMVLGDLFDAAEMRIFIWPSIDANQIARPRAGQERRRGERRGHRAQHVTAAPIGVPSVVIIDIALQLPGHRPIGINIRAVIDLLNGQLDRELTPPRIGLLQDGGREKDFPTGQPIAGIDNQPTNHPARVFE